MQDPLGGVNHSDSLRRCCNDDYDNIDTDDDANIDNYKGVHNGTILMSYLTY